MSASQERRSARASVRNKEGSNFSYSEQTLSQEAEKRKTPSNSPKEAEKPVSSSKKQSGKKVAKPVAQPESPPPPTPPSTNKRKPLTPATSSKKAKPLTPPTSSKKAKSAAQPQEVEDDGSLFSIVQSEAALPVIAKDWVNRYKKNPDASMLELVNLIFQASGATETLTKEAYQSSTETGELEASVDSIKIDVSDYAVHSKATKMKRTAKRLLDLWSLIVRACTPDLLVHSLVDTLWGWLMVASTSTTRALRHTSTLIALKVLDSLVVVATQLQKQIETTMRQIETEKKSGRGSDKQERLQRNLASEKKLAGELDQLMTKSFESLYVERYRDVVPEIRCACIESLGGWIQNHPRLYFRAEFLKYIAWSLSDRAESVRLIATTALKQLYSLEDSVKLLSTFTTRFKSRFLELTKDVDAAVSAEAICLCGELYKKDLLADEEAESFLNYIKDSNKEVRYAASKFVHCHVEEVLASEVERAKAEGSTVSTRVLELVELLGFFDQYFQDDEISIDYFVDGCWPIFPLLHDYQAMAEALVTQRFDQQGKLIKLLSSCVKKAAGLPLILHDKPEKLGPVQAKNAATKRAEMRAEITEFFLDLWPKLAKMYEAEAEIVHIIDLVRCFDFNIYSVRRQQTRFKEVVNIVKRVFLKGMDTDLLDVCATTFEFLLGEAPDEEQKEFLPPAALRNDASVVFRQLTGELSGFDKLSGADAVWCLNRISALYAKVDLSHISKFDTWMKMLKAAKLSSPADALCRVMSLIQCELLWNLNSVTDDDGLVGDLIAKRDEFVTRLTDMVNRAFPFAVRSKAFELLCDLCVFFSPHVAAKSDHLPFEPSDELFATVVDFLTEFLKPTATDAIDTETKSSLVLNACKVLAIHPNFDVYVDLVALDALDETSTHEVVRHLRQLIRKHVDDMWKHDLASLVKTFTFGCDYNVNGSVVKAFAKRLAESYGICPDEATKDALFRLVIGAMDYATSNIEDATQLGFLEICTLPFLRFFKGQSARALTTELAKFIKNSGVDLASLGADHKEPLRVFKRHLDERENAGLPGGSKKLDFDDEAGTQTKKKPTASSRRARRPEGHTQDEMEEDVEDFETQPSSAPRSTRASGSKRAAASGGRYKETEDDDDIEEVDDSPPPPKRRSAKKPSSQVPVNENGFTPRKRK